MNKGSVALRRGGLSVGAAAMVVASLGSSGVAAADTKECAPTAGFNKCQIFTATGSAQDFQVPSGIQQLEVRAWGQGGVGTTMASGGAGAFVTGKVAVTPGEHLSVRVAGLGYGDALGGKGSYPGSSGGASSAIRTADSTPLVVAAGGGGGGFTLYEGAQAGAGGAPDGLDASTGAKGAHGAEGGAASGTDAAAGEDHAKGGAGGAAAPSGGGGGGGYAGGGGGGAFEPSSGGSGGGGSSYADKERLSDVKMLGSERYQPPAKDDPFWQGVDNPVDDGTATGGSNSLGGYGLVVLQWKGPDKQAPAELTHASGDGQTVKVGRDFDPLAVVVRDKNGAPVTDQKVVFTLVDPDRSKLHFSPSDVEDGDELPTVTVKSDAQGVATSSPVLTGTGVGDFTVRADAGDASTTFSLRVTPRSRVLKIVSGDGQKADPGEEFAKPLKVELTEEDSQFANTGVTFEVQGDTEGAPTFKGGESSAETWTNPNAVATAPDLTAGKTPGTYKIVATSEETTATFEVTVVGSASASPTPSASTSASPSAGASTSGGSGPGSAQGGSGGGHLALTGAAGIGTLAAAAATLAALGWAAMRFGPRLRTRRTRG